MDKKDQLSKSRFFDLTKKVEIDSLQGGPDDPSQTQHLPPDSVVDQKYKIIKVLAQGGMGVVYKAHHLALDREVALKTLRSSNVSAEAWIRFAREAKVLSKLAHPNIVQILDFGYSENNAPYYTMENISGESLADRMDRRGIPTLAAALKIFLEVAQALAAAHKKGIIHRDIKPANIFLAAAAATRPETAKVLDFGIAGMSDETIASQVKTATGTIFGSPLYMSPEQSMGEHVGPASDVYSFGCALFEAISGNVPFYGENAFATMLMHQSAEIPNLTNAFETPMPQRLKNLVQKSLAKDPDDRPQSFTEIIDELNATIAVINQGQSKSGSKNESKDQSTQASATKSLAPFAIGFLSFSVILIAAAIMLYKIDPNIPGTTDSSKNAARTTTAKTAQNATTTRNKNATVEKVAPGQYFVKVANGTKYYHFPNESIGTIVPLDDFHTDNVEAIEAKGDLSVPLNAGLQFEGSPYLGQHPQLLEGFRPNDLRNVTLTQEGGVSNEMVSRLAPFKSIEHLRLDGINLDDRSLTTIGSLNRLVELDAQGAKFTATGLASLPNLKHFDTLIISHCSDVTGLLKALVRYQTIKKLVAMDCNLSDKDIEILSNLKTLKDLNICNSTAVTKKGLQSLSKLNNLFRLMIEFTSLGPECEDIFPKILKHNGNILVVRGPKWPKAVRESLSRKLNLKIIEGNHLVVGQHSEVPVEELWKPESKD